MDDKQKIAMFRIFQVVVNRLVIRTKPFDERGEIPANLHCAMTEALTEGINENTTHELNEAVDDMLHTFFTGVKKCSKALAIETTRGRQYEDQGYVEQDLI